MTRVYLIRVGMDSAYGGFVAPYFEEDKNILYIPVFSENVDKNSILESYNKTITNYPNIKLMDYFPNDKVEDSNWEYDLNEIKVHHDPEFTTNTYGENKKKLNNGMFNKLKDFKENDYILFYGSFYPCNKNFKYINHSLSSLKKIQSGKKQFYIFAFLKLKYPPITRDNYKEYFNDIEKNVHVIVGDFEIKQKDIFILKGKDGGYLRPIRIDNGKKGSTYQMNDFMFQFKLNSKRGLNRCYCELESSILNHILKNRLTPTKN